MNAARTLAEAVLEGESPKQFFRRKKIGLFKKWLPVGRIASENDDRDTLAVAMLEAIRKVDPKASRFLLRYYEDLQKLQPDEDADYDRDAAVEEFVHDQLSTEIAVLCPPYTLFGAEDGALGVWPDPIEIKGGIESGQLKVIPASWPEGEALHGNLEWPKDSQISLKGTRHLLLKWPDEHMSLWDARTLNLIWEF